MNIEQNSTYRELSEEDCTMVQGGVQGHSLLFELANLGTFNLNPLVEHAEKPGNE